jgi:GH3 auxin-responsive promoter
MRWAIDLLGKLLTPAAQRFQLALQQPQITQARVQSRIFKSLLASEYGKSLGISTTTAWAEIPIIEYADLSAWVECQKVAKTNFLSPEPVIFYERTSGSRSAAKWIPYTRSLRRAFSAMFGIWAHDLIQHGAKFTTGRVYFCVSPQLGTAPAIDAPGLADDSAYLDGWLRLFLRPFLVSVAGINRLSAADFKHQLCLALIIAENLEIISIWSPSFLTVHLDYIHTHRDRLRTELAGKISADRSQLLAESVIPWAQLWPQLKLISCWDSAAAADRADQLRSLFPQVLVQGKGLLATEAPMTIPLLAAGGCVPIVDQVLFEFEDSAQSILKLHELAIGEIYTLIISQMGGLYRYRIGDRVRVTHFYLHTPCLEFVGRDRSISDLVGEKLQAEFVQDAIASLGNLGANFQSLAPVRQPQEHYVLLLDRTDWSIAEITDRLEAALCRSAQYYHARSLGQLAPLEVLVSPHIPELLLLARQDDPQQSQVRWGDIKHQLLAHNPIRADLLAQLRLASDLDRCLPSPADTTNCVAVSIVDFEFSQFRSPSN